MTAEEIRDALEECFPDGNVIGAALAREPLESQNAQKP
jgi:hypothetical protein